jgi:subtilisin family serine protease
MARRFLFLFACLLSFARAAGGSTAEIPIERSPERRPEAKLSPGLRLLLAASAKNESVTVLVDLREQLDFGLLQELWARERPSKRSRGLWIRQALAEIARRSDRHWIPLLKRLRKGGDVRAWSRVTIVNRLVITGRPAMVRALARRRDVAAITEEMRGDSALESQATSGQLDSAKRFWPLAALQVPSARAIGLDGKGVVVGLIDSGASNQHEQLSENFRTGSNSWFDPLNQSSSPADAQTGHGSAVLSCAVGRSGEHGGLGVAPAATWIAAVGLERQLYNNVILTAAADWMLNVGRPDVLIIPWKLPERTCDPSMKRMVNAWRAAGIVVIFAAGNSGPEPETDVSPANYTDLFPHPSTALSVGAVGEDLQIYERSSRGPNRCGPEIFPQLVAPGVDVPVAFPAGPSLYRQVSGTSFAAGFVAGAAALLLQKFPDLPVEEVEEALRRTAVDLGAAGPDPVYGFGFVDIRRAVEFLQERTKSH